MKLIISMQDGRVNMISVNRIQSIVFEIDCIAIKDSITNEFTTYLYSEIRSMVIA